MFAVGGALILFGIGLLLFGKALIEFNEVSGWAMLWAALAITGFGVAMALLAPSVGWSFAAVGGVLLIFAPALLMFGKAIKEFNDVSGEAILKAGASLVMFGALMGVLAWQATAISPAFPILIAFSGVLMLFGLGLAAVGLGLKAIADNMSGVMALTTLLASIVTLGPIGLGSMMLLSASIIGIAMALMMIPEEKSVAFSYAMSGYGSAMAAVAALSPESVTAAERIVKAAGEYVEIQAEMKMPDEDSFVQAMKSAFGGGEGAGGKKGQDIVLVMNGREFGRAVDASINSRHNLKVD
jgi:hypothetical protein